MMRRWNVSMATAWAVVSMGTCLPPATRLSQWELQGALSCREVSRCPSPIQRRRWIWHQRLRSLPSPSTRPPSQPPTYQRPTTSRAKRSTPKRRGRARSPPRHSSSDPCVDAADAQVTSRHTRDSDLNTVNHVFFLFVVFSHCQSDSLQFYSSQTVIIYTTFSGNIKTVGNNSWTLLISDRMSRLGQ